ncbi:hypothetical protein LIER_29867 [Lithospermum erythrorhizon]|uniref:Uncharacterized protein n=1 Tax=Lithospermum erythrorhizon TaxID=34254 RepID=A0AAV3RMF7_LITER
MLRSASSLISLASSHCHACPGEGVSCSISGASAGLFKQPVDVQRVPDHSGISFRCQNSLFGGIQLHWTPRGQESFNSRVSVAADFSDSVPDSSNLIGASGYHPLEEIRNRRTTRHTRLTDAEIARTTVEANNNGLLIFPGLIHSEPHEQNSWAEYGYIVDEYGDIFFEINDDENILQDIEASNPVNALIGIDLCQYESQKIDTSDYSVLESDLIGDIPLPIHYLEFEADNFEAPDEQVDWGMPDSLNWVHPTYFSKCLTKAFYAEYDKMMDYPSNGVSIWGQLKPAYIDEEIYLRRLFNGEDSDDYISDWKDNEHRTLSPRGNIQQVRSTFYRLDIVKIELFSVYGVQSAIRLHDFQDAEPDILVHTVPGIVERLDEGRVRYDAALRALCRKKGLNVEGANLIGIDSLGINVRVLYGSEVQTHRFPFKVRAMSEGAAEKQIRQLLFPPSRRKKLKMHERVRELDSF